MTGAFQNSEATFIILPLNQIFILVKGLQMNESLLLAKVAARVRQSCQA